MKRILVTGSLGTVGRQLVNELTERGHKVYGCDLAHDNTELGVSVNDANPTANYYRCDVGEYRQIERLLGNTWPIDLVYHAAAEFGRWNGEDFYEKLWQANAIGTKNILRLQEKWRFQLVHFSSSEVYGDWDGVMIEEVPSRFPIHQMNDYAMSKWVNEMQIANSIRQFSTESVIVRLFNTYGPGEYYSPYRSVNCRFLYCALKGLTWKVFQGHSRTSTFLTDTIRTLANIADQFKRGSIYNIGGEAEHTIEHLSDLVVKITGASPTLAMLQNSELLTTGHKKVDCSKAIKELGHKNTIGLEEGLNLTAQWMRRVYNL